MSENVQQSDEQVRNVDYPDLHEGWAFPTPEGREHYFRDGRSLCGRHRLTAGEQVAGRLDESDDPCGTCDRIAWAEVERLWCVHQEPPGRCDECSDEPRNRPTGGGSDA